VKIYRPPSAEVELAETADGVEIRQAGSRYLARDWLLTDQVQDFVSACVAAGLGCFIRHSHPKVVGARRKLTTFFPRCASKIDQGA
jgi:hypothetical protein